MVMAPLAQRILASRAYFGAGDPINYSDPFGLCPDKEDPACSIGQQIEANIQSAIRHTIGVVGDFGNSLRAGLTALAKEGAIQAVFLATGEEGNAIRIGERELAHVLEGHSVGGALSKGKSIFNVGEDFTASIRNSEFTTAVKQRSGRNFECIVNAGREVGVDHATGQPTSLYTVIANLKNELVTMFPGTP